MMPNQPINPNLKAWDLEARQHEKRVYFNKPQLLAQYIGAKTTVIVAGRRTGKTDSIASPFVLRNMQRMPGSTGGIVVPTFKHGLTNTIPGLLAAWKRWGYINGIHYVVGRKPPKSFAKPITEPADYEHVITFYNGSVAIIISQDRPGSSNSLTLSWLLIDEAKFIDYNKLKDETLPANGGIRSFFGHHSFNHSMMVLSDMPQTQKGSWFLHYREKMDPELIEMIQGTIFKIWQTKQHIADLKAQHKQVPELLPAHLHKAPAHLRRPELPGGRRHQYQRHHAQHRRRYGHHSTGVSEAAGQPVRGQGPGHLHGYNGA